MWSPGLAQEDIASLEEKAIAVAVDRVAPSVVQLETIGGLDRVGELPVGTGPFSAVVLDTDGYLITSAFNLIHQPAAIFVRLPSGQRVAAEKIATDESRKLSLLKIEPNEYLVPIKSVGQSELRVGQTAIAVGRTYDAQTPNVSVGIVSAMDRIWGKAIQTDAKVSPANFGGPLIDLRGQMIGILTPLSPESDELVAGSEWYDSGIGFAVPLSPVLDHINLLKSGNNLVAGKLGISLEGSDIYSDVPRVAFCHGASPAALVGIRPGDVITEINGESIVRQSQMKHALGPLYAGDRVQIKVRRQDREIVFEPQLADSISAFTPPGIGLIARDSKDVGGVFVEVIHVITGGAAETAGLRAGDRIVSLAGTPIRDTSELRQAILGTMDTPTTMEVTRQNEVQKLAMTPSQMTATPVTDWNPPPADSVNVLEIKVPEFANRAFAVVPQSGDGAGSPALVVWVAEPGEIDQQQTVKQWQDILQARNVCALFVESRDAKSWTTGEVEFIRRSLDLLRNQVDVASERVVIAGAKAGGAMAALTAFKHRERFRGLATIDAVVSQRLPGQETSAVHPLLIYFGCPGESSERRQVQDQVEFFVNRKFPVHVEINGPRRPDQWADRLAHWAQTVDRL